MAIDSPSGFRQLRADRCFTPEHPPDSTMALRGLVAEALTAVVELQHHVARLEKELAARRMIRQSGGEGVPANDRHGDRP